MLSKAPPVPEQAPENDKEGNEAVRGTSQDNVTTADRTPEEPVEEPVIEANVPRENQRPPVENVRQPLLQAPAASVIRVQRSGDGRLFTLAAIGLTVAIAFLLLKKFMKASGYSAVFMNES